MYNAVFSFLLRVVMVSTYGVYQSQNECFARPRMHLDYLSLKGPSIKIHSNWWANAWRRVTMDLQLFSNFKWYLWQLLNDYPFNPKFVKILFYVLNFFYVCRYPKTCMCKQGTSQGLSIDVFYIVYSDVQALDIF